MGRKIKLLQCVVHQPNVAASTACANKLIGEGAKIMFTTCDVDLAAPVVQPSINHGLLTIAPCIGTDQMGPKRFGSKGKLAFSFGNVAQDEGSAMAQFAWNQGWKTADLAKDKAIVYFKAVVSAFKARFLQLGGKINYETTYTDHTYGGNDVGNAVTGINSHKKPAVIVTSTAGAFGSLGSFITGLRTAGNKTPVLNSWAGDGTYWTPGLNPPVTNYWFVTYANAFGHDPNPAVNKLAKAVKAGTGGFITGPAAIDGVVTAIKRAHGSLVGSKLAAVMQKFHNVPTLSGKVSFSKKLHSVFGRQYRMIEINNNKPIEKGLIRAKVVPNSPDS
jgi:branched-chain amino acid transport system substrate-binding protein